MLPSVAQLCISESRGAPCAQAETAVCGSWLRAGSSRPGANRREQLTIRMPALWDRPSLPAGALEFHAPRPSRP